LVIDVIEAFNDKFPFDQQLLDARGHLSVGRAADRGKRDQALGQGQGIHGATKGTWRIGAGLRDYPSRAEWFNQRSKQADPLPVERWGKSLHFHFSGGFQGSDSAAGTDKGVTA
jgi:hypothetical protein